MLIRQPSMLPDVDYAAIQRKINADYTANQALWLNFWAEATLDTRLEAGDTSLMGELNTQLPNNNRGSWYFNRVRPLCNLVTNVEIENQLLQFPQKMQIKKQLINGQRYFSMFTSVKVSMKLYLKHFIKVPVFQG